jgi:hypothetical protein
MNQETTRTAVVGGSPVVADRRSIRPPQAEAVSIQACVAHVQAGGPKLPIALRNVMHLFSNRYVRSQGADDTYKMIGYRAFAHAGRRLNRYRH